MLIPEAVLHPQQHCWMWLNQHSGAPERVFITLETCTKQNVDRGNELQNDFYRYRGQKKYNNLHISFLLDVDEQLSCAARATLTPSEVV